MKYKKQKKTSKKLAKKVKYKVKKALLKRQSIKNHKPTVMQAQSWFNVLNKGIFSSQLQMPKIIIQRLPGAWGECECSWDGRQVKCSTNRLPVKQLPHPAIKFKIKLRTNFNTWKDFIETLAHEMVHLYQMTIDRDHYSNHNANFYKWRNKLKQFGLRLCF